MTTLTFPPAAVAPLATHERQALNLYWGLDGEQPRPLDEIAMKFGQTIAETSQMLDRIERTLIAAIEQTLRG